MSEYIAPHTKKTPVISLLGLSGSGKSTVAESVTELLADDGIACATIKKDHAIRELGKSAGSEAVGYIKGSSNDERLHSLMNFWIREAFEENDILFLEGGTRTEKARSKTMKGLGDTTSLTIVRFEVSPLSILRRLHERRHEANRADDSLAIMAGKLIGQSYKDFRNRNQVFQNADYITVDADRPVEQVIESVETIARQQLQ